MDACRYVGMYVNTRRYQHMRVRTHTGPRRHARAPTCRRHHTRTACPRAGTPCNHQIKSNFKKIITKPHTGKEKPVPVPPQRVANPASRSDAGLGG